MKTGLFSTCISLRLFVVSKFPASFDKNPIKALQVHFMHYESGDSPIQPFYDILQINKIYLGISSKIFVYN